MTQDVVIKFTRKEALSLGLLICTCGHPPNNHFAFQKKACAHCKCKEYQEIVRTGVNMVNSYGSILDMHQDELKTKINLSKYRIEDIGAEIVRLQEEKKCAQNNIEYMENNHKMYLEMIELIGKPEEV